MPVNYTEHNLKSSQNGQSFLVNSGSSNTTCRKRFERIQLPGVAIGCENSSSFPLPVVTSQRRNLRSLDSRPSAQRGSPGPCAMPHPAPWQSLPQSRHTTRQNRRRAGKRGQTGQLALGPPGSSGLVLFGSNLDLHAVTQTLRACREMREDIHPFQVRLPVPDFRRCGIPAEKAVVVVLNAIFDRFQVLSDEPHDLLGDRLGPGAVVEAAEELQPFAILRVLDGVTRRVGITTDEPEYHSVHIFPGVVELLVRPGSQRQVVNSLLEKTERLRRIADAPLAIKRTQPAPVGSPLGDLPIHRHPLQPEIQHPGDVRFEEFVRFENGRGNGQGVAFFQHRRHPAGVWFTPQDVAIKTSDLVLGDQGSGFHFGLKALDFAGLDGQLDGFGLDHPQA